MQTRMLQDGTESFEVSVHEAPVHSQLVLFAVGAGGQPERYVTLMDTLAESGCMIVAPHFDRLVSPDPGEEALTLRARRLSLALDAFVKPGRTAAGVGHSIGAAVLLALAGAQMWLGAGRRVSTITSDSRLTHLSLLATPTDFFQAPGALDAVKVPLQAWVGSADNITPPSQTERLAHAMRDRHTVDIRIIDGAGHFSFMDRVPPQTTEPLSTKQAFLQEYAREVCAFVVG